MKELTVEQKAKRYDEALEIINDYYQKIKYSSLSNASTDREVLEKAFPQLKESDGEDERIVKELLTFFRESIHGGHILTNKEYDSWITWLEKQIEQNSQGKSALEAAKEEKVDNQNCVKLANEVEPKFKVGDWIVSNVAHSDYRICKIIKIENGCYTIESTYGYKGYNIFEEFDNIYHLWTIQDAKAGDVLFYRENVKYSNGIKYERICLFKNLDNAFFTLTKNYVEEYDIDVNIDYPDNTVPATKEQKEILFMVMADAGYTFDFEKKELKKIEQKYTPKHKVGDTIYYNSFGDVKSMIVANVVADSTNNPMYEDENGNVVFEEDLIEYNTVWSEEDEKAINDIMWIIEAYRKNGFNETHIQVADNSEKWIKSLKDRVQPKLELSDVDKSILFHTIDNLKFLRDDISKDPNYAVNIVDIEREISWLKSLRPQPNYIQTKTDNRIRHEIINYLDCQKREEPTRKEKHDEWIEWLISKGKLPITMQQDNNWIERIEDILDWAEEKGRLSLSDCQDYSIMLSSFKHQNTWKPSDEQMNALDSTLQYSQVSHNSFEHLNSLFNDLKKLKR